MNIHFTYTKKLFKEINVLCNEASDVTPSRGLSLPGFRNCVSYSLMPSSSPSHGGRK